jgi:hypothetical protein
MQDIQVLLQKFNAVIKKLTEAKDALSPSEQNKIALVLSDIFNYLSEMGRKPNLQHILLSQAAHDARIEKQFVKEREQLDFHRRFVESNFDKADQYLRTIQLSGYAIFFAVWGITREWITPFWGSLAAILMIISAVTFVVWEIWKATLLSLALKNHAIIASSTIEDFVRNRMPKLIQVQSRITKLVQARATIWIICVIPAFLSLIILVLQLLKTLLSQFILPAVK